MPAPLEGLLVLDFTRLLPGPFATQLLCNLGADVIKIEDPGPGDYMRTVPPSIQGVSYAYLMVNRGKRSLSVDLKRKEGREILYRLVPMADVVMEQFRPGVMKKLGADHKTLAKLNPKLIYCSFSGYGQTGPAKDVPGHDITFEAHAGILGVGGDHDGRPAIPGVPMADLASGFNAAMSVLAALRTRDRTGKGEFLDVSIFDTAVSLMVLNLARYLATGEEPVAGETLLTGTFPFYNIYETSDGGWLAVAVVESKFWEKMCDVLEVPELKDAQFTDDREKARVLATLRSRFRSKSKADWEALLAEANLPIIAVKSVAELVRDPQVKARELLPVVDVPGLWKMPVIAHPAKHSVSSTRTPARAPTKGEDTEEILRSLGYKPTEIEALGKTGVIARG
jgi:crotonobetainyl-CoA:carnitine CoA-transferase CaiB-like acyl-CoA transferase